MKIFAKTFLLAVTIAGTFSTPWSLSRASENPPPATVEKWDFFEVELEGPGEGNPFIGRSVKLPAREGIALRIRRVGGPAPVPVVSLPVGV
ncbi:MAG: hypothetical protein ACREIA_04435 [Opitutaceae bacterium]